MSVSQSHGENGRLARNRVASLCPAGRPLSAPQRRWPLLCFALCAIWIALSFRAPSHDRAAGRSSVSLVADSHRVALMASERTTKADGGAASSASASQSLGYPSLLPGSIAVPPSTDPFWYDALDPTTLWNSHLSLATPAKPVQPMQLKRGVALPPKPAGHLRFVAISDTHNYHSLLPLPPPPDAQIDVLLHAGDWSNVGEQADVDAFTSWIRALPLKFKVVIAGNHDVSFDESAYLPSLRRRFNHRTTVDSKAAKAALTAGFAHEAFDAATTPFPAFDPEGGVAYLEDSGISIAGIRIWGSPWQPEFYNWGYNLPTGEPLRRVWSLIPSNTQVLMTHGPPLGHGDLCLPHRNRAGCVDLLMECTTRIHPRFHVFGHIHEGARERKQAAAVARGEHEAHALRAQSDPAESCP